MLFCTNTKIRLITFLIGINFFFCQFKGYSQYLELERFNLKDGYLDETLDKVTIDSAGRLLLFSRTGINIYDGKKFTATQFPDEVFTMSFYSLNKPDLSVSISEVNGIIDYKQAKFNYTRFHDSLFEYNIRGGMTSHGYPLIDQKGNLYFWARYFYYFANNKFTAVSPGKFSRENYSRVQDQLLNMYVTDSVAVHFIVDGKLTHTIPKGDGLEYYDLYRVYNTEAYLYFVWSKDISNNNTAFKVLLYDKSKAAVTPFCEFNSTANARFIQGDNYLYLFHDNDLLQIQNSTLKQKKVIEEILGASIWGVINDKYVVFFKNNSIILYDLETDVVLDVKEFPLEKVTIKSVVKDKENNIWFCSDIGLYKLNLSNARVFKEQEKNNAHGKLCFADEKSNRYYITPTENKVPEFEITKFNPNANSYQVLGRIKGQFSFFIQKGDSLLIFKEKTETITKIRKGQTNIATIRRSDLDYIIIYKDQLSEGTINKVIPKTIELLAKDVNLERFNIDPEPFNYKQDIWLNTDLGPIRISDKADLFIFNPQGIPAKSERLYSFKDRLYYSDINKIFSFDTQEANFNIHTAFSESCLSKNGPGILFKTSNDFYIYIDSLTWTSPKFIKIIKTDKVVKRLDIVKSTGFQKYDLTQAFIFNDTVYFFLNRLGLFKVFEKDNSFIIDKVSGLLSYDIELMNTFEKLVMFSKNGIDIFTRTGRRKIEFIGDNKGWSTMEGDWVLAASNLYALESGTKFSVFRDGQLLRNRHVNPITILSVLTENSENSAFYYNVDSLKNSFLRFPYKTDLTLRFTSSCLTDAEKVLYKYKIEGLDTSWHYQREAVLKLMALAPGNYRVKISACNNDGVWYQGAAILQFTIVPPWYRTMIAYIIYFVIAIVMIYVVIKNRTRKLEKEKLKLEQTVAERTEEIINEKKIVEEQKHLIEEKQKEVMDSIKYARRIQNSLLPTEKYIEKFLGKFKEK